MLTVGRRSAPSEAHSRSRPDDPRWQDRTIWSEVIVDAPTAAFARQYAAEWALQDMDGQVGNESPSPNSGFEDEKLYWARRVADEARHLSLTGAVRARYSAQWSRGSGPRALSMSGGRCSSS